MNKVTLQINSLSGARSYVLFVIFGYLLSFLRPHKQQRIVISTLFTADVKGTFAELFSILVKRGHVREHCPNWLRSVDIHAPSFSAPRGGKGLSIESKVYKRPVPLPRRLSKLSQVSLSV